jgi:hypothetical protein
MGRSYSFEFENGVPMACTPTFVPANSVSPFDEEAYLRANPDVARAVAKGVLTSGKQHFDAFGHKENRMTVNAAAINALRAKKMKKLAPLLTDAGHGWSGGKPNFLTDAIRAETKMDASIYLAESRHF